MTNRGTAYILYVHEVDAEAAIAHMHEAQLDGCVINVSIVLPRRKFSPAPPTATRGANIDPRVPAPAPRGGGFGGRGRGGGFGGGAFGGPGLGLGAGSGPGGARGRSSPRHGGGRGGRGRDRDTFDTYRPTRSPSYSRSRSPARRGRSPSYDSRSKSPPRRRGGGGGRRDSPAGDRVDDRRRSPSYDSYRSRSRSRGRGRR